MTVILICDPPRTMRAVVSRVSSISPLPLQTHMDQAKLNAAREQLRAHFGASLEEDLLEQCTYFNTRLLALLNRLGVASGAEICKNNNITGDDFYFKWEAISYNTTPRVFDKDSIQAIKDKLERDAAKVKVQRAQIKGNLSGLLSKNLGGFGRGGARNDVLLSKTTNKPQPVKIKTEGGNLAGPSKVRITRSSEPIPRSCECFRVCRKRCS